MSIFEVKNIKKIFQPTNNGASLLAIENVSFKVRAGEFVSLMGPTGCGKTTLLKIISGLEFPTEGEVSFDGQKVSSPKKEIVLMAQSEDLLPGRTVTRNSEFGLEVRGVGREDRRKKSGEMIKTFGLSGFEEFYPKNLSGGMRRKVSFIRSVITDPAVMLMDEPFIFLDENTKDELQVFLQNLWMKTGQTIIFVTHSLEEAIFLGERIVVLSKRPSRVEKIYDVSIGFPRDRFEQEFMDIKREIGRELQRRDII